jgi:hypothetical protein
MSEGLVVFALVVAVLIGVGAASFLVMRTPAFWGEVIKELATKAWPQIWAILSKRMPAEQEAEWRKSQRLPDGDTEFNRKRRGAPPKG